MYSPNNNEMSIERERFIAPLRPGALCEMSRPDGAISRPAAAARTVGLKERGEPALRGWTNAMAMPVGRARWPCG